MPIESICGGCGRTLRVADEYAGRRARCPACQRIYTVPERSTTGREASSRDPFHSDPLPSAIVTPAAGLETGQGRFFLQTSDGQVYGPVERAELVRWCDEGRIDERCRIRRDPDGVWQPADRIFPVLAGRHGSLPHARSLPPGEGTPQTAYADHVASNARTARTAQQRSALQPHRGILIIVLGGLSWFFSCPLFGVFAWSMGSSDLAEMRAGRMDDDGEALTQIGRILGMVHVLIAAAIIGGVLLMLIMAAVFS